MTANALFWVEFEVTSPGGTKRTETVSLSSPDLRNANEAHRRARKTAQERLLKRERKVWGMSGHKVGVKVLRSRCVG